MNTLEAYSIAGREEDTILLEQPLNSNNAELLAVYGRRRISKTFLIQTVFANHIVFELSGHWTRLRHNRYIILARQWVITRA